MTERGPRIVLAVLCAAILAYAVAHTGHSAESLDVRTYVQMIRGVADHGLPYWDNGPIDRFPELVVAHGTPAQGKVWGIYSPLYPYLAAPIFKLGGLERVSTFTFATLAPLAIVTFLLAKRVVKNEWYATAAAVLAIVSTPILGKSLEITPFPLTTLLATLGTYYTVRLVEPQSGSTSASRGTALLCGATWAAASAAHVLSFPMALAAFAVLAFAPDPTTGKRSLRLAGARLVPSLAAFVLATFPVSYLNHIRFDSWNPISYGRPPFSGPIGMSIVDQARYGIPVLVFAMIAGVAIFAVRKRGHAWIAVLLVSVVVGLFIPTLRERLQRYATLGIGYIVDIGWVELGPPYEHAKDGLGQYLGQWIAKAMLQSTPLLVLSPLALRGAGEKRWPLVAMLFPSVALFASFVTRANMPYVHGFGWPWVYMRYTVAALPAMLVASVVVVERLKPSKAVVIGALVFGGVLCAILATSGDKLLQKRVALLILPIVFAIAVFIAALRSQAAREPSRIARALVGITVGFGIAISLGHDFRAHAEGKYWCDHWVDSFVKVVPPRFALVGELGHFDVLLSTTATHDVRYVTTHRMKDFADVRPIVDHWRAEGRPIYLHWQREPHTQWGDVSFERVEPLPDLYLFVFSSPAPAPTAPAPVPAP